MAHPKVKLTIGQRVKIINGDTHHGQQGTVASVGNGPGLSVKVDSVGLRPFNTWEVEVLAEVAPGPA
jgi:hypothetical protein